MTIFAEVEGLVNSRPLTYVSDDIDDLEAITPNHFLLGRASPNLNPTLIYQDDVTHRKRRRRVQALTCHF